MISDTVNINNVMMTNPKTIADTLCQYFNFEIGSQTCIINAKPQTKIMNPTNENEIGKVISSLKPKNSAGYDNISY